ncbi:MAG: fatty-acyl-CoA synthase [Alphaproteobacteria bacterium]|nr:fatty-acyl-CoA synthase [Alphaproteobacteria bacterium]
MTPIAQALKALDAADHWLKRAPLRQTWLENGLHTGETLPQIIERKVAADPDIQVVFGSRERPSAPTTSQMLAESLVVARGLRALGLVEGDVVAMQLPNWSEAVVALLATWRLGMIAVPIVHTYGPAEMSYILETTCARALFVPDRWRKIDYDARIQAFSGLPYLEHVIVLGDGPMSRPVTRWEELLAMADDAPLPALSASPDDACLINFTSGTTSAPKGVVHTHHSLATEMVLFPGIHSPEGRPRFMPMPGGHIAGLIGQMQPFLAAMPMILMDHFDEALTLELCELYRPDRAGGVPFHVEFFCDHAEALFPDGCLQMSVGAANVAPTLMQRCDELGWPSTRSYGSTEHPTISGTAPDDSYEKRTTTDGALLEGISIRLVDDEGADVTGTGPGEIVSMGPELCKGYLDPVLNAAGFAEDGWFLTGDIGVLDEDGFLTIVDRKKDIIIRGGENISSKEVEDVLRQHPEVVEVAAVGWPDQRLGERVGVFVRVRNEGALDLEAIKAHFRSVGTAIHKTPEFLVLVDDYPRTPAGKIIKVELRERARTMQDAAAGASAMGIKA